MSDNNVHVFMCETCGMMPRFKGLQGFLRPKGYTCDFEYGNTGDFEVHYRGQLIYSKQATGAHPIPPQVLEAIEKVNQQ
ncbi:Selenoprotein_W [Hexamita inflata]|uniref:Selenoprotein_W n=1 Tax=Hexamita inflata TaxID=28002 RepID=A0ABP1GH77_9EUKA